MNNRPRGRQRNITGQGKDVKRRGAGLGSGPVGKTGRPPQPSVGGARRRTTTRSGGGLGGGKLILLLLVLFLGGGGGVGALLSGGDHMDRR